MDFIKKHYEKLILLLLLVIFIASMFHVLNIIKQTGEIQEHHLQIPTREADYKIQDPNDPSFNVPEILKSTSLSWVNPGPRAKGNEDHYSDLSFVFRIVRCPFCKKLIPRSYMEKQSVCPFCKNAANNGEAFAEPPDEGVLDVMIPEDILRQYQLDPNDPDVRFYDIDGDGFSNIYEYVMKTDMGDPRNHPPLWHRLRVIEVGKVSLPVKFTGIDTTDGEDDPQLWVLKFNNGDINTIGGEIELDRKYFKIEKAERKVENVNGEKKDASILFLKEVGGNLEVQMKAGETVRSFADKAQLEDSANPGKRITVTVGEQFSLGNRLTGSESYRVKSFDTKAGSVLLENPSAAEGDPNATKDKNGTVMLVSGFGQVSPRMKVRERQQNRMGEYGPDMPYGPGGPYAPGQRRYHAPGRR